MGKGNKKKTRTKERKALAKRLGRSKRARSFYVELREKVGIQQKREHLNKELTRIFRKERERSKSSAHNRPSLTMHQFSKENPGLEQLRDLFFTEEGRLRPELFVWAKNSAEVIDFTVGDARLQV